MTITYKMLNYPISSGFGSTGGLHQVPHSGIDIATPSGTPAQSLTAGTVESITTNDPFLGASVCVDTGNGTEWAYGHLSQVDATVGQVVNAGDVLGLTGGIPGTPGAGLTTGAHLHLAATQGGVPVDPSVVLQQGGGFWRSVLDMMTMPGAGERLAGVQPATVTERIFDWLNGGVHTFIQVSPEIFGVLAMVFLLAGMVGWKKGMANAGTCVLLTFVGVLLNAAIS